MFCFPLFSLFLSFLINGSPISRTIGHRGSIIVSITLSFIACISSVIIWYEVIFGGCESYINLFNTWFSVGSLDTSWSLYYDSLAVNMILTVAVVNFAVQCYSAVYMKSDPHLSLFLAYLSLFTFFMGILVSASQLLVMFVGFEGIGVSSFLLIGYWSHRLTASKSALKAIVVNRISDGLLLWSIIWLWWHTGTLDYDLILLNDSNNISNLIGITILLGSMAKSVQILFHVWLADSMEGPTPVSALIHAATLVTAGIYVMIRLSIFDNTLVLLVGALTAIMGGVFGLFQNDLKRVIAFSTCSQLGYMLVSLGLGELGVEASMSHLMSHASFKAGLFLAAGVVIMSSGGYQKSNYNINETQQVSNNIKFNIDNNLKYKTTPTINHYGFSQLRNYSTTFENGDKDKLPESYVEYYEELSPLTRYEIKQKYEKVPVIYYLVN